MLTIDVLRRGVRLTDGVLFMPGVTTKKRHSMSNRMVYVQLASASTVTAATGTSDECRSFFLFLNALDVCSIQIANGRLAMSKSKGVRR